MDARLNLNRCVVQHFEHALLFKVLLRVLHEVFGHAVQLILLSVEFVFLEEAGHIDFDAVAVGEVRPILNQQNPPVSIPQT